jgi:electron transfer flavoprotein alpha subunit
MPPIPHSLRRALSLLPPPSSLLPLLQVHVLVAGKGVGDAAAAASKTAGVAKVLAVEGDANLAAGVAEAATAVVTAIQAANK